jgi:DNA-binding CsgD family transcriptional regulator
MAASTMPPIPSLYAKASSSWVEAYPIDDAAARQVAAIRGQAVRIDCARDTRHGSSSHSPLELWQGLRSGHWQLLDWFDFEGRRFFLTKRAIGVPKPVSGLTIREQQVLLGAARGESCKVVGLHLELSRSRVSSLLRSAMRKLGVKTHAQLVLLMRELHSNCQ